jgi:serine/threonine-protein kinase
MPGMKPGSTATTLSLASRQGRAPDLLLTPGQIVRSPETHARYSIEYLLGTGGFGQAFRARRGGTPGTGELLCLKASRRIDGWLREAYFGQVLDGHPRAIRVLDAFPVIESGKVLYCLALEYARYGDLRLHLRRTQQPWHERKIRAEIAGILQVLGRLHRGQTLHRDLTPLNVLVCDSQALKLGDFGIARLQSDTRGVTAGTMNRMTAPSDILDGTVPKWQARDDVYQVGQLLGMLVRKDADRRIRTADVRGLACSDHLKEIVHRCIGERRKRYESADEMIEALQRRPESLRPGSTRTLKGVHLAFTGTLTRPRIDAARAARRAGAVVHGAPSAKTTVLVRGRPNKLQAAGRDAGLKLMEVKRLRDRGHKIKIIDEARFWRLVTRKSSHR